MELLIGSWIALFGFCLGYKLAKDDKLVSKDDIQFIKNTLGIKNKIKVFHTLDKKPETIENIERQQSI